MEPLYVDISKVTTISYTTALVEFISIRLMICSLLKQKFRRGFSSDSKGAISIFSWGKPGLNFLLSSTYFSRSVPASTAPPVKNFPRMALNTRTTHSLLKRPTIIPFSSLLLFTCLYVLGVLETKTSDGGALAAADDMTVHNIYLFWMSISYVWLCYVRSFSFLGKSTDCLVSVHSICMLEYLYRIARTIWPLAGVAFLVKWERFKEAFIIT